MVALWRAKVPEFRLWHHSDVRPSAFEVRSALLSGHAVVGAPGPIRATTGPVRRTPGAGQSPVTPVAPLFEDPPHTWRDLPAEPPATCDRNRGSVRACASPAYSSANSALVIEEELSIAAMMSASVAIRLSSPAPSTVARAIASRMAAPTLRERMVSHRRRRQHDTGAGSTGGFSF